MPHCTVSLPSREGSNSKGDPAATIANPIYKGLERISDMLNLVNGRGLLGDVMDELVDLCLKFPCSS